MPCTPTNSSRTIVYPTIHEAIIKFALPMLLVAPFPMLLPNIAAGMLADSFKYHYYYFIVIISISIIPIIELL